MVVIFHVVKFIYRGHKLILNRMDKDYYVVAICYQSYKNEHAL